MALNPGHCFHDKKVKVLICSKKTTVQLTTRTTEDGIPELTRIPEKIATTEHFILLAR